MAVDLRYNSETFGKWEAIVLSEVNHKSLYIPAGFAHGFQVLSDDALVSYKCIGNYDGETDSGIRYNDEELNIVWNKEHEAVVSKRDMSLMTLAEFKNTYGGLRV